MLKGETEAIGKLFERTMMEKHGVQNLGEHYLVTDTICDATQERQDAIYKLVDEKPDIMMIVGGFNSSNTSHLQEISEDANITSFWVDTADRIDTENNKIAWRTSYGEMRETENWLPEGKLTIGITSGASTPDKVVEDVLEAIFMSKAKTAAGSARRDNFTLRRESCICAILHFSTTVSLLCQLLSSSFFTSLARTCPRIINHPSRRKFTTWITATEDKYIANTFIPLQRKRPQKTASCSSSMAFATMASNLKHSSTDASERTA